MCPMATAGSVISLENHDWHLGEPLASGGFGSVHHASSDWMSDAVLKLIPKTRGADRELLFEDLSGVPNVVPVLDRGEWEDHWVLAMPRADKSLREHLSEEPHIEVDAAVEILRDVAEALVALENRVVHRDIKPENILLWNDHWCLADFGISRYAEATTASDTRKLAKTNAYAAPEQWREERASSATDVYATGVVAYELLAGERPFPGPDSSDYRDQHLHGKAEPIENIPDALGSLVLACLVKRPEGRPRAKDVLRRLGSTIRPSSVAAQRLLRADAAITQRRAEEERLQSVALSQEERRQGLLDSANQALIGVIGNMRDAFREHTSEADFGGGASSFTCSLGNGLLTLGTEHITRRAHPRLGFEVVTYTNVTVTFSGGRHGYEGRSHSLWYCDAQDKGVFRWFETAFMVSPYSRRRAGSQNPFALSPEEPAYFALRPGMDVHMVAWPFTPIDQGEEGEFIERWMEWFAEATEGSLREPSHMPEVDTGEWRWEE